MNDKADLQAHVFVELAHPLGVAAREVIVDRYDVDAVSCEGVEVGGQCGDKGLALTGFHFGDASLMEHDAADDLNGKMLHSEHAPARLTAGGKSLGKDVVQSFAVIKAFSEKSGLVFQLALGHIGIFAFQRQHLVGDGLDALDLALAVVAEQ